MSIDTNKIATIIDIKATDTTKYAHATQISWTQIAFTGLSIDFIVELNPHFTYQSRYELCYPFRDITSEQKGLNGIHAGDLIEAQDYRKVLNRVMGDVEDDYIICHDAKVTKQLLAQAGVPVDAFNFICMSSIIKKLYPSMDSYTVPTLIYEFCENIAISYMPHYHTGRYDVTFMRHIFKQVSILKGLSSMQDWYELGVNHGKAKAA